MAGNRSSATFGGDSGSDDDWSSLLREADPDDVEKVILGIVLRRSVVDQGGSGSGGSTSSASGALIRPFCIMFSYCYL